MYIHTRRQQVKFFRVEHALPLKFSMKNYTRRSLVFMSGDDAILHVLRSGLWSLKVCNLLGVRFLPHWHWQQLSQTLKMRLYKTSFAAKYGGACCTKRMRRCWCVVCLTFSLYLSELDTPFGVYRISRLIICVQKWTRVKFFFYYSITKLNFLFPLTLKGKVWRVC